MGSGAIIGISIAGIAVVALAAIAIHQDNLHVQSQVNAAQAARLMRLSNAQQPAVTWNAVSNALDPAFTKRTSPPLERW